MARFVSVDPLAEDFFYLTTYQYAGNTPIQAIDLDGLEPFKTTNGVLLYNVMEGQGSTQISQDLQNRGYNYTWQDIIKNNFSYFNNISNVGDKSNPEFKELNLNPNDVIYIGQLSDYDQIENPISTETPMPIENETERFWNSVEGRYLVPDFISIEAGFSSIFLVGSSTSAEFNWVTRGPEASIWPIFTISSGAGIGYDLDATFNIGVANYIGPVEDINKAMLQTSIGEGGVTYWMSGGFSALFKGGGTISITPTNNTFIFGREVNFGAGLPAGPVPANAAFGVKNTWIIPPLEKKD